MNPDRTAGVLESRQNIQRIQLLDLEPVADDVRAEVRDGLSRRHKTLPCKLFYDQHGSELFDAICELPEYYPTRTELAIMRDHATQIADVIGPHTLLVEYGSGSSHKTRILLDHLRDCNGYVPIDISRNHLLRAARALMRQYPHLPIRPVCADYTRPFSLPIARDETPRQIVAYFPGSTIGNFEPDEAQAFLEAMRSTCGAGSGLLIGLDLKKDPAILHAAYNDSAGVTEAFNLNILNHVNHDVGSDFDLDAFAHYAFFNPIPGRMEMHLVSRRRQIVHFGDSTLARLDEGESIHTESCYKYTLGAFDALATEVGYHRESIWTDPSRWFSVQYFVAGY